MICRSRSKSASFLIRRSTSAGRASPSDALLETKAWIADRTDLVSSDGMVDGWNVGLWMDAELDGRDARCDGIWNIRLRFQTPGTPGLRPLAQRSELRRLRQNWPEPYDSTRKNGTSSQPCSLPLDTAAVRLERCAEGVPG